MEAHIDTIPFTMLGFDAIYEIISHLPVEGVLALSMTSKDICNILKVSIDQILCKMAMEGTIRLTYITEHKPFIDRIRKYFPEFTPLPCDYYESESEEYEDVPDSYSESDNEVDPLDWDSYGSYTNTAGVRCLEFE